MKPIKLIILSLLTAMISSDVFALTLKSSINAGGNWNTATTWNPAGVPGPGDSVVITSSTVTLNTNATVGALTLTGTLAFDNTASRSLSVITTMGGSANVNIGSLSGVLTIGGATGQVLYLQGNFTCSGIINWPSPNTTEPKIVFNGTGTKTLNNTSSQGNFEVNSSSLIVDVTSNLTQIGNMTVTAGILDVSGFNADYNGSSNYKLTVADGATLRIGGTKPLPQNFTTYIFGSASTVEFEGTNQTIANKTYGNLILDGSGTKTMPNTSMTIAGNFTTSGSVSVTAANAISVNGNFTIGAGTTFSASTFSHSVKGNFINSGVFNPNTSTFTFGGSAAQSITGVAMFNNFILNNSKAGNALTLNSPVIINGNFTLTDGHLITTTANILTLGPIATVSLAGNPQDSSFVKGPMINTIATSTSITKIFPVGKGTMIHQLYLTATQFTATATQYNCEYINSSATALNYTLPSTLSKVSDMGYWNLIKGSGATVTSAMVKLYYLGWDGVTDASNLRVAKDNGGTAWLDLGGSGTTIPTGTISSITNFTSFGKFSLANHVGGNNPLPIELIYFNAQLNHSAVDIKWATTSELNSESFELERSSDGTDFTTIAKEAAAGYSNELKNYATTDNSPLPGHSYYRLKQVDYDGKESYSNVVSVDNDFSDQHAIVYNNPLTVPVLNVRLPNEPANDVQVTLHNMNGEEVFSKKVSSSSDGMLTIPVDSYENLSSGMYLLTLVSANKSYREKLMVQ